MSDEPEMTEEVWTYGGARVGTGDKRIDAWYPEGVTDEAGALWFAAAKGSRVVGGLYRITVSRRLDPKGKTITSRHGTPVYIELHDDAELRAALELRHRAADTQLRGKTMERNDKRKSALDEVLAPLEELLRKTAGPDRDAVMTYISRKLYRAW